MLFTNVTDYNRYLSLRHRVSRTRHRTLTSPPQQWEPKHRSRMIKRDRPICRRMMQSLPWRIRCDSTKTRENFRKKRFNPVRWLTERTSNRKKVQMEDEKPKTTNHLKSLLVELQCQIFEYLSHVDLINLVLSDSSDEAAAGYALQRKHGFLSSIGIVHGRETVLAVRTRTTLLDRISTHQYTFEVENAATICEGYEEKKGNNLTRAIHFLFSYYNCPGAFVYDNYSSSKIPLTLEAFFGPASSEPEEKIKIGRLNMSSYTAPLLGWLSPKKLFVQDSPDWLLQTSQKELKESIAGIDQIDFSNGYMGRVDTIVEACEANLISIGTNSYWSDESIFSIVKANTDAHNNGITRRIKIWCKNRSISQWRELFAPLMNSYEATGSGDDEKCTIQMPKCTFQYNGGGYVIPVLSLH